MDLNGYPRELLAVRLKTGTLQYGATAITGGDEDWLAAYRFADLPAEGTYGLTASASLAETTGQAGAAPPTCTSARRRC